MNDEPFPEEALKDAEALFRYLSENTDLKPSEMALEWVFIIECPFELEPGDESLTQLIESFTRVTRADEDAFRVEVQHLDEDVEAINNSALLQILLIYTSTLTQQQLDEVHAELDEAARTLGFQYVGVECGLPGEMDEMKFAACMDLTDELMNETCQWEMGELDDVAESMRSRHVEVSKEMGLEVAAWMPTAEIRGFTQLRPQKEIVRRLMAAHAAVAWVLAPEEEVPSSVIKRYVKDNGLVRSSFSEREADWIGTSRKDARESMGQAGWAMENMWGLAWILGNAPLVCPYEKLVPYSITRHVRDSFFCNFDRSFDELMAASQLQPLELIITLEDFFYCIHNGFRNMCIRSDYRNTHDNERCGLMQERRQALTWALSPGVQWDDADVST